MQGKIVTVINRSEIVGRPLAAMLANDGADVYSVDIDSIYLFRGGRLHMVENETVEGLVRKVCWCYLLLLLFIVINSYQLLFIGYVF